jgi:dihydrofolate reductase
MNLEIVVAIDEKGGIGKDNQLLWHLPADLKHFKNITSGYPIIMGRKTYDSIGKPLPNRRNIVISRQQDLRIEGTEVVNSLEDAIQLVSKEEKAFIIGGAQIFSDAMLLGNILHLTKVHHTFEADTFFPQIKSAEWQELEREDHLADEKNPFNYSFITLKRR